MNKITVTLLLSFVVFSCELSNDKDLIPIKQEVVNQYGVIAQASYQDAVAFAGALNKAITDFSNQPSAAGLELCRHAWLTSRNAYLQTEAFRFYGGPIDTYAGMDGYTLDAAPIHGAGIDYWEGNPGSGIINDLTSFPILTEDVLLAQNKKSGSMDIKTGFHAIEFLLWGQDLSVEQGGQRPYTDFVVGGTASNPTRRLEYLLVASSLLLKQLTLVSEQWAENGRYRSQFENPSNLNQSLTNILTGMGRLTKGELEGRRLRAYMQSENPEAETSAFSDNSAQDLILSQKSIENVYFGRYTCSDGTLLDGPGWDDLLNQNLGGVNKGLILKLEAASTALKSLPVPMDQHVHTSPEEFNQAILALRAQADQFVFLGNSIGIKLVLPDHNL